MADAFGTAGDTVVAEFMQGLAPGFALIWGTTSLALRTGLYRGRLGRI